MRQQLSGYKRTTTRPELRTTGRLLWAGLARFGPRAATPIHYHELDWAEEVWMGGCILAHFGPGGLTSFGPALSAPVDRIHWAGTKTSGVQYGGIDGAIRSGERAAQEVLAALSA